ncbi:AGAP008464-PA, partial [Anopheles gambiae str. PEST]
FQFFIAIMAVAFVAASEASYLPYDDVLSYQHSYGYGLPVSKVVYGSSYGLPAALDKYSYPSSLYGSYPAVKKVLVAPVVATKVVDNGLWNYGGYGLGYN